MQFFDQQTADDLEFNQIRQWLSSYCRTTTMAERMLKIQPLKTAAEVEQQLQLAHELQLIRNRGLRFPRMDYQEIKREIKLLEISASVLEIPGIINLLDASIFVNELFLFFKENPEEYPQIMGLLADASYTKALEKAINQVLDKRMQVKDDASETLFAIRQRIANLRKQINRNFDKALRTAQTKGYIDEIKENIIDNRRVMTVISSFKRQVKGSILGASKSGSLTYIEPEVNRALNFELDQLLDDERKEIHRILAELTDFMRGYLPLIKAYQSILLAFDAINAKVRLANQMNGVKPQINHKNQDTYLKEAYHPILWMKNKEAGIKTIPQTLELKRDKRILVISGPNAGGKSIALKTVGLLQLMFQSALLVPLSTKSRMGFFDFVLSDIGDNQSIENQLSTYSYRLQRMHFFLKKTSPKTLLLLDEFGTGSDPDLGGALAEVFFETIYDANCFGVITTHYSNIKWKAAQLPEAVNANMLFNRKTLSPEYQLMIGQPGSSFTFEVAKMNGIPGEMIKLAKDKVDRQKLKFDKLLSDLQRDKSILKKLKEENYQARQEMETVKEEFEEKSEHYEEKLKVQQKRIERNDKYLSHGKKMSQFVQNYPSKSKKKQAEFWKDLKKYITIEKAKIDQAVKKAQEALRLKEEAAKAKDKNKKRKVKRTRVNEKPLAVGGRAKMKNSRQVGEVVSIDGKNAVVVFGNLKAKVNVEQLVAV